MSNIGLKEVIVLIQLINKMDDILEMLHSNEFYAESKLIEIAKGKYKKPESLKEGFYQIKRALKWQKKKLL